MVLQNKGLDLCVGKYNLFDKNIKRRGRKVVQVVTIYGT